MKILHVYKSYYPYTFGGIEKCIETLCKNAQAFGVQSDILSVGNCETVDRKLEDGITKIYYPKTVEKFSCPFSVSLLKNFKKETERYDVIHYHFPWPFSDLLQLITRSKKPYIITYHSDIIRQKLFMPFYLPFLKYFFSRAKYIVATSQNYVDSSPVLQRFLNKVRVIPIGLDDKFHSEPIKNNKPYFLFLGVLRQYKGLQFLIEAMRGVVSYHLIIAGDGPCFAKLKELIDRYQLTNVTLLGCVTEEKKHALYQNAYAVVSSAHLRNEAYCYMLVEGLMFGKPLISTELNTGTSFVNQDGETGIVVQPCDPNALRKAMDDLIEDQDMAAEFSSNARPRFLRYFTADKMTQAYVEMYRGVA